VTTPIFFLRGTTEPHSRDGKPTGLLAAVAHRIDRTQFHCVDVDYPAAIGPANPTFNLMGKVSAQESTTRGVEALTRAVHATGGPYGVIGYSLGAMVVSQFLEQLHGPFPRLRAQKPAFVGLVANPLRAEGDSIDGKAHGWGIAGQHKPWPVLPVFEVANPSDPITACRPRSPLRPIGAGIMSSRSGSVPALMASVYQAARDERAQFSFSEYAVAAQDARGYLGGEHTSAYLRAPVGGGLSPVEQLADLVNTLGFRAVDVA
jgi:hypothetical protein